MGFKEIDMVVLRWCMPLRAGLKMSQANNQPK